MKINTNVINDNQMELLNDLDSEIKDALKGYCGKLNIATGTSAVDRKGKEKYHINHNACPELTGSQDAVASLEKILEECDWMIPTNVAVLVKLNFKSKDVHSKFVACEPKYGFDQIILPNKLRDDINDSLKMLECKDLIFNTWGYGKIEPVPKCILSMEGPAGTGKTMCAHAIAKKLGKKIMLLNYADIESKYMGEAAQNLMEAFNVARKTGAVMFFDEADSFLGKRIENVSQGSDQALNSQRSQMLTLLEQHDGVVLFATNLVSNFDNAFNSRIQKHLIFELPNKEARIKIIKSLIPEKLPLSSPITDEDLSKASEYADGFNGREIKNAIFNLYLSKANTLNPESVSFNGGDFEEAMRKKKEELENLQKEKDRHKKEVQEKIMQKLTGEPSTQKTYMKSKATSPKRHKH